jgi:diacylglycerol O-acyltransferase / wax synthase
MTETAASRRQGAPPSPQPARVPAIERASAADLGQLASDAGSVPNQVGAVLLIDVPADVDVEAARTLIGDRLASVPRLRQRLVSTPLGLGPPIWVDDRHFDIARHVTVVDCPVPGNERSLLQLAASRVTAPLPRELPLWSVTFVTGLENGQTGMVMVFHHVMTDGIGGLAVLAQLLDGSTVPSLPERPRPPPSRRQLRLDTATRWLTALRGLPSTLPRLREAIRELGGRPAAAPRCSLNRPTSSRRQAAVVRAELATIREVARAHDATVNDVALTAVSGALTELLRHRGEQVDRLVISMPVAARTAPTGGNRAGIAPIELPTRGTPGDRLREIAAVTRARKQDQRGASAGLLGVGLRTLARLRVLRWFIDHQRMVHTFVTNLRGPDQHVTIAGMLVTDLVPISLTTGNVTVAFAASSYAGTLTITIIADPTHHPDLEILVRALQGELASGVPRTDPRLGRPGVRETGDARGTASTG